MNSETQGVLSRREMLKVLTAVSFAHQSQMARNDAATSFYAIFRRGSPIRNSWIGSAAINGRRTNIGGKYLTRRSTGRGLNLFYGRRVRTSLIASRLEKQSRNLRYQSTLLNGTVTEPTAPEPSSRVSTRISVELGSIVSRRCNTNPVLESDSYSC